ncbi:hypothetical protein PIB30_056204, partial [Stylosanthes scabra]|nr:hypothetical protein [Stylosanthes scabra]
QPEINLAHEWNQQLTTILAATQTKNRNRDLGKARTTYNTLSRSTRHHKNAKARIKTEKKTRTKRHRHLWNNLFAAEEP